MIEPLERLRFKGLGRLGVSDGLRVWNGFGVSGVLGLFLLSGRRCPWSQSLRWQVRLVCSSISTPGVGVEMCYDSWWGLAILSFLLDTTKLLLLQYFIYSATKPMKLFCYSTQRVLINLPSITRFILPNLSQRLLTCTPHPKKPAHPNTIHPPHNYPPS